jgi:ABC-2 type transport system permease protein
MSSLPAQPSARLSVHPAMRFVRGVIGRAYPRIIGSNRDKSWLAYDTILPLLGTIAFVYVYRALGAPERFTGYVIMGGATVAFWSNVVWMMATQFYWEKRMGNLELYMLAPCGLWAILLGMALGGFLATMLRAVAIVGIGGLLFHVSYSVDRLADFLLVFALAMAALYGLGMTMASLFLRWGREAWHGANLMMEPVFFVSGVYFPVHALGMWLGVAASLIPLTLALDAMRQALFGSAHPALFPMHVEVAGLAALTAVFLVTARSALRRMELAARREGVLGDRE